MSLEDLEREELKRLRMLEKHRCPKCGSTDFSIESFPDFRYSNSGSYGVKCRDCGHRFTRYDDCTG